MRPYLDLDMYQDSGSVRTISWLCVEDDDIEKSKRGVGGYMTWRAVSKAVSSTTMQYGMTMPLQNIESSVLAASYPQANSHIMALPFQNIKAVPSLHYMAVLEPIP